MLETSACMSRPVSLKGTTYTGAFGGGLYILFDRNAMQHYASVKNSTFMSNFGELGEEGLFISWLSTMVPPTHRGPNGCCV